MADGDTPQLVGDDPSSVPDASSRPPTPQWAHCAAGYGECGPCGNRQHDCACHPECAGHYCGVLARCECLACDLLAFGTAQCHACGPYYGAHIPGRLRGRCHCPQHAPMPKVTGGLRAKLAVAPRQPRVPDHAIQEAHMCACVHCARTAYVDERYCALCAGTCASGYHPCRCFTDCAGDDCDSSRFHDSACSAHEPSGRWVPPPLVRPLTFAQHSTQLWRAAICSHLSARRAARLQASTDPGEDPDEERVPLRLRGGGGGAASAGTSDSAVCGYCTESVCRCPDCNNPTYSSEYCDQCGPCGGHGGAQLHACECHPDCEGYYCGYQVECVCPACDLLTFGTALCHACGPCGHGVHPCECHADCAGADCASIMRLRGGGGGLRAKLEGARLSRPRQQPRINCLAACGASWA